LIIEDCGKERSIMKKVLLAGITGYLGSYIADDELQIKTQACFGASNNM